MPGKSDARRRRRLTATPVANRGIWRSSAALGEFEAPFLNRLQRSVNRKVQGSSPCPGATSRVLIRLMLDESVPADACHGFG